MIKNKSNLSAGLTGVLAVIMGSLGLTFIFSKIFNSQPVAGFDERLDEYEGHIRFRVILGSGANYVKSDKFASADLKCRFGYMDVYFDDTELIDGKGIVKIDLSYGTVELYVPRDWHIVNNLRVGLGTVDFVNEGGNNSDKTLILVGNVSLGAVEITYV